MWAHHLSRLDGWWCIVPDLRGVGASDAPADEYSMARYADDPLVVCGAEDEVSPPASMREMAQRIPDARYVVVPGAGHLAPLEQPEAVTEALRDYFAPRSGEGLPGG